MLNLNFFDHYANLNQLGNDLSAVSHLRGRFLLGMMTNCYSFLSLILILGLSILSRIA